MAWPPATLPTNRTNATPQNNTHPADHNTISAAVNDTVGQLAIVNAQVQQQGLVAFGSPSIPTGATVTVAYASLSTAAWGAGPTFVAPSGTTGIFAIMADTEGPAPVFPNESRVQISVQTGVFRAFKSVISSGETGVTLVGLVDLTGGDQVSVQQRNNTAADAFYNVELRIVKVSI